MISQTATCQHCINYADLSKSPCYCDLIASLVIHVACQFSTLENILNKFFFVFSVRSSSPLFHWYVVGMHV